MPKFNSLPRATRITGLAAAISLAGALGAIGLAATASASPADRFPISISDVEAKVQTRFNEADTDANGEISLDEFQAVEGPSRRHKGRHFRHHGAGRGFAAGGFDGAQREDMREAMKSNLFSLLDSDADGNISSSEFDAADHRALRKQARKQTLFEHLDADGNGALSSTEMPNPAARLQAADADNNGEVTREELREARRARMSSEEG